MFKLFKRVTKAFVDEVNVLDKPEEVSPDELVKQIHNEVDDLENKSIKAVEELLSGINIPTENQVTKKADLMKSLGFNTSNETIKQSESIRRSIREAEELRRINEEKLRLVNEYRLAYPTDKIIPMSEFLKVIEKYNLIYAPASAYIKDVPEKNLLEIKNAKKSQVDHRAENFKVINDISLYWGCPDDITKKINNLDLKTIIIPKIEDTVKYVKYINLISKKHYPDRPSIYENWVTKIVYDSIYRNDLNYELTEDFRYQRESRDRKDIEIKEYLAKSFSKILNINFRLEWINSYSTSRIVRDNLFISAPKTHFDLSSLSTHDGREFYMSSKVQISKIPDPIAFYILKGPQSNVNEEFVRIVSKWGTSDDQSYLDPIVQDQRMN